MTDPALPPGPRIPPILQILNWVLRPIGYMERCRQRYGDSFTVNFPGFERPMVLVSAPEDVARLFKERDHGLPPGRSVTLAPLLGERSLLLLEGSEHLARRKLMLPPFHGDRMRAYAAVISRAIDHEIDSWPIGEEFRLHPRMQAVTLEVILKAVFGVTDESRLSPLRLRLAEMLEATSGRAIQLKFVLSQRLPWINDPLEEIRANLEAVDELLASEVAERRADPGLDQREDILSMLVAARFEDGEPLSDPELRDQLMTLLLAGHETTATALAWTFDLLVRHPDVLERLRADLETDSEALLKATISESLRLRPVIPLAGRRLGKPMLLNGTEMPVGTDVAPAIWLTHTHPETYPDAKEFRPERFLDDKPDTYGWIPFGGGIRRCIGAAFAEFEMKLVLRSVIERCDLEGARSRPERIARRNITFSPKNGTPVVLRDRRAAAVPVAAVSTSGA